MIAPGDGDPVAIVDQLGELLNFHESLGLCPELGEARGLPPLRQDAVEPGLEVRQREPVGRGDGVSAGGDRRLQFEQRVEVPAMRPGVASRHLP